MLRILRALTSGSPVVSRWVSRITMDLSVLELVKFLIITIFTAHWLACIWGFVGNHYSDNAPIDLSTWYIEDYRQLSWVQKHQMTSASPIELYCVALYVALANIFGGPTDISPANYFEFMLQSTRQPGLTQTHCPHHSPPLHLPALFSP